MKHFIASLFIVISISASAQIINVESLRKVTDTSGFTGSASLNFSMKRDSNDYLEFNSDTHIQYKTGRHLALWKNDINFKSIEGNRFQNSGATHLRYNYKLHSRIAWEIFGQAQYNKESKINFRGLLGTGPRIKLTNSEDYKVYFGTHIMLEQEELSDGSPVQRDYRSTSYLSMSLYPTPRVTIVSTTYFQPRIEKFRDYRASSETSLVIDIFKQFAFKSSYVFTYEQYPAIGVPNSQYTLKSGVVYTF